MKSLRNAHNNVRRPISHYHFGLKLHKQAEFVVIALSSIQILCCTTVAQSFQRHFQVVKASLQTLSPMTIENCR